VFTLAAVLFSSDAGAQIKPEERLPDCFACHGAMGRSQIEGVPSLGGMPRNYILVQLILFREKRRLAEPMNTLLSGLSDEDLESMSDLLAALPASAEDPVPENIKQTDEEWQHARALAVKYHCVSCHGADLAGHGQIPRIAGQREEYVLKSLRDYKNNTRSAYQPAMIEAIKTVPDTDIPILAKFVSQFR
jgi:cytochrome c553